MNGIFSATVCLTSSKSCFVTLSGDLAQRFASSAQDPVKVIIFKVERQGGVVFVSWSGDVMVNRSVGLGQTQLSVVEISRKFAELNGIQNSEQILLTHVDRTSTPSCTRIHVDPFSPDDWEILELHAGFIESNLLNQIRVVWKGQVLPIWINKTTCIVINIGETEPDAACVVLEEFTEVIIAPKERNFVSSKKSEIPATSLKKEQEKTSHLHHARENDTSKSQVKVAESSSSGGNVAMNPCTKNKGSKEGFSPKFLNWWNYFLHGEQEESSEPFQGDFTNRNQNVNMDGNSENSFEDSMKRSCCVSAFERVELDLCLRNQMDVGILQRSSNQEECRKKVGQDLEPFAVFVHPNTMGFNKLKCGKNHSVVYPDDYEGLKKVVIIRKVLSPKERVELFNISKRKSSKENETSLGNQGKKDVVTKQENSFSGAVVKMVLSKNVLPGHIAMHSHMQKQLGSLGMSHYLINDVTYKPQDIQGIILHPVRDALNKIEDLGHEVVLGSFIDWVSQTSSEKCPLILWDGATVAFDCLGRSVEVIVTMLSHIQSRVNPESTPYYNITPSTLEKIKVVMGEAKSTPKPIADLLQVQTENKTQLCCSINDLGGFDEPFHKCLKHLSVSLQQDPLSTLLSGGLSAGLANGAVLICGSGAHVGEGCGKTSLAHAVCQQLQQWPICAHVTIIDCILLRAKRVETIQRHWQQAFLEAAWHQPSVILLDNLDHVISVPSLAQEMGGEGFYRKRLVEVFKDLVATEVANNSSVAVIATSRSRNSLHTALQSGRGSHVFQCCVELGALNERQRMEILSIMIKRKFQETQQTELDTVLENVVKKSEGFLPKDLSRVTERAVHFSVVRKINETKGSSHPSFILDDFNQALSGFIPASLQGVQLHKAGDLSWADVGGLHDVKSALKETLLWPSKYRKIFSKCPLRLRSGLLLYGPPGTGKTLLAGVVAKESGLNFISIKGPELLSKFIGASEQAVRDVFTRAQTAKPCILFFDEFDSLAPRRGHDSTGVTDRVVNQLLTQLDGVEGLEGVYILAATSRPGLIDPALLRPGRLDKCVYCPIPNKSERLEILLALTRHLPLADNVDLKSIADKCDNFTGADLKALLYNAQLESIHRSTSKLQLYGNIFDTKDEIKQPDKTRENMTEAEQHSSQIQDSVFAFSIGGGMKVLSREDEEAIENEVTVLQKNHQALQTMEELVDVKRKPDKKENVIYISQSDLDKAASTIRPSVSPKERLIYENIFDSFIKSRGGSFTKNLPMEEKATLA